MQDICLMIWREISRTKKFSLTWMYAWGVQVFRTFLAIDFHGQGRANHTTWVSEICQISHSWIVYSLLLEVWPVWEFTEMTAMLRFTQHAHSFGASPTFCSPQKNSNKLVSPTFVLLLRNEHISNSSRTYFLRSMVIFFLNKGYLAQSVLVC